MTGNEAPEIIVSVAMPVYNQANYIEQAVTSVVTQQTDFAYELVIGDDCSTDDTPAILSRLQAQYPDKIRLLLREQNMGHFGSNNFADILDHCRGTYIAILEGDDYWTSPHKLQKQVEFMRAHPACTLSFHAADHTDALRPDRTDLAQARPMPNDRGIFTLEEVMRGHFIYTASMMFKPFTYPPALRSYSTDYLIQALVTQNGEARFIPGEPMVTYRHNSGGISYRFSPARVAFLEQRIEMYQRMKRYFGRAHHAILTKHKVSDYYKLFRYVEQSGDRENRHYVVKFARHFWRYPEYRKYTRRILRSYATLYWPRLMGIFRWAKQRLQRQSSILK